MASTSAAITAVFSTTELAEAVLDNLDDFYDLLSAIRVCTKFRDVVRGSSCAQQNLFLQPGWSTRNFLGWRTISQETEQCAPFIISKGVEYPTDRLYPVYKMSPIVRGKQRKSNLGTPCIFMVINLQILARWAIIESPWLEMLVTQPPMSALHLIYKPRNSDFDKRQVKVERQAGVRWIDVFERLKDLVRRNDASEEYVWKFLDPGSKASRGRELGLEISEDYFDRSRVMSFLKCKQKAEVFRRGPVVFDYQTWRYLKYTPGNMRKDEPRADGRGMATSLSGPQRAANRPQRADTPPPPRRRRRDLR